jgi:hypothetical protein
MDVLVVTHKKKNGCLGGDWFSKVIQGSPGKERFG